MPSSSRLSQLIESAYNNDDVSGAIAAYNEWQISHCYHPYKQRIYDSHIQDYRYILCPCGSCYHCLETKVNEWVTRMYAHLEDFKHAYFITLTYRSFYSSLADVRPVDRLIMNKLSQAVWHRDSLNYNHRTSYNPCLLVKSHYQNFIKRLRKYTGINDISYVLCGEYGSDYGRPHFHAIIFTNTPLTRSDIVRAWSVALWRSIDGSYSFKTNQRKNGNTFYFPIGRVDFNDLVSNGTLNTIARVKVDGNFFSASRCFAYVCKYVTKRDSVNYKRVDLSYSSLFSKDKFVCLYDNEVQYNIVKDFYLQRLKVPLETYESIKEQVFKLVYEKTFKDVKDSVFSESLEFVKSQTLFGKSVDVEVFPQVLTDYRDKYAPFVEFSRGRAIGSLYAINHLQEFKEGVFNKPLLQDKGFVVPAYFRNKAKDSIFGLRKMHKTFKGVSYVKGGLLDFYRLLKACNCTGFDLPFAVPRWSTCEDYQLLLRDSRYTFRDSLSGEKSLIIGQRVKQFLYDRHSRKYISVRDVPLSVWVSSVLESLQKEFHDSSLSRSLSGENLRTFDSVQCILTDLGVDYKYLCSDFVDKQTNFLTQKKKIYKELHKSCE